MSKCFKPRTAKKLIWDYNQMSCTSSDLYKTSTKFQKDPAKTGGMIFAISVEGITRNISVKIF